MSRSGSKPRILTPLLSVMIQLFTRSEFGSGITQKLKILIQIRIQTQNYNTSRQHQAPQAQRDHHMCAISNILVEFAEWKGWGAEDPAEPGHCAQRELLRPDRRHPQEHLRLHPHRLQLPGKVGSWVESTQANSSQALTQVRYSNSFTILSESKFLEST